MTAACPTCKKPAVRAGNKGFPFCCARCQLVDLGRWLAEDYRIPVEPADGDGSGTDRSAGDPSDG